MDEVKMDVKGMMTDEYNLHQLVNSFFSLVGVAFSPSQEMTCKIRDGAKKAAELMITKILDRIGE
jgi:hypothetical protein